jgi:hypothetical protein
MLHSYAEWVGEVVANRTASDICKRAEKPRSVAIQDCERPAASRRTT